MQTLIMLFGFLFPVFLYRIITTMKANFYSFCFKCLKVTNNQLVVVLTAYFLHIRPLFLYHYRFLTIMFTY